MALDAAGKIYLADSNGNRIVRMDDLDKRGWVSFGTQGNGRNEFTDPTGIFVDRAGHIYVADSNRITRIDDMTGRGWTTLVLKDPARANHGPWEHLLPKRVAVDPAGRIYAIVGETQLVRVNNMTGAGLVIKYFADLNPARRVNPPPPSFHYTPRLSAIAVDSAGRICGRQGELRDRADGRCEWSGMDRLRECRIRPRPPFVAE